MGGFNKKGSTIVEAAVVFPLVIMTVVATIFILTFMFNEVASQAKMQVAVNAKMGQETKTVYTYKNVPTSIKPYSGQNGFISCYIADEKLKFKRTGILSKSFVKKKESSAYEVNEKKYIRYVDFLK